MLPAFVGIVIGVLMEFLFFMEADPSNQFHLMNFYNMHKYLLQVIMMMYMWQYMNNDTSLLMIRQILIIEINTLHLLMH